MKLGENVKIKVTGQQFGQDGNKIDEIQLITEAKATKSGDVFIIDYTEKSENQEDDIKTRIRATKEKLTLTKISIVSSTLEFEKNKSFKSSYSTPYGNINMTLATSDYLLNLDNDGFGNIHLMYDISLGDSEAYTNVLNIDIY